VHADVSHTHTASTGSVLNYRSVCWQKVLNRTDLFLVDRAFSTSQTAKCRIKCHADHVY